MGDVGRRREEEKQKEGGEIIKGRESARRGKRVKILKKREKKTAGTRRKVKDSRASVRGTRGCGRQGVIFKRTLDCVCVCVGPEDSLNSMLFFCILLSVYPSCYLSILISCSC